MLKRILIGLAAIVLVFAFVVALLPSDFRVARSATIAAPPAVVFSQVNDFHKWMKAIAERAASRPGGVRS